MVAMLRFVTLVALLAVSSAVDNPTVQLPLGSLRGTRLMYEGRAYHAYRGVPYAEPPERFKEAARKRPWSGMLDATEDGPSCLQRDAYVDDGDGAEYKGDTDCLFLNVYTPAVKGERGFPIIVYIHGGGYTSGHAGSEWVNPQYFMLKDVVVVTVAYRLGVFGSRHFLSIEGYALPAGFLCTGDDQALANLGLRDQWLALRWVRAHGPAFGGAPDRVTLMGHDAGAASVHLHMLAPVSRGLFSRAISQSGVWLDWWLGAQQPRQSNNVGVDRVDTDDVGVAQFWSIEPLSLFRPCVDTATASPFLPVDPLQLLEDGQVASVPWLLGVTSDQGLFRLAAYAQWLSGEGACHGDDLLHLFEMPKLFPEATTTDKEAIQAMVTLWTNFAKDGYPVANRERPSGEPECWPADKPEAAGAVWPAASEDQPWFVELRGDQRRGERLRACPRLHLPAVHVRLRYWDQLPMAENLNLSLNYHKVQPDPKQDTREYYDAAEEPSSAPRVELHSLLCVFHLLIIRHISPLYSISEHDR
ncbi:juvenile hormone esterase-like [Schistocerca nitens]|uniref:juvenile hormone esterase-like n=1 Tax=Schistocerca nitens TaxID=7011 RepID=UPI00211978BA|nr:juvenile hormone esterase-like [Schistocerca nitens]